MRPVCAPLRLRRRYRKDATAFDAEAASSAHTAAVSAVRSVAGTSGVSSTAGLTGDPEDAPAWATNPLTAEARITDGGALTREGRTVALAAAAIGRRRGFRLSEPSPMHDLLLREIASGRVSGVRRGRATRRDATPSEAWQLGAG
jgi:hypothetical protein